MNKLLQQRRDKMQAWDTEFPFSTQYQVTDLQYGEAAENEKVW